MSKSIHEDIANGLLGVLLLCISCFFIPSAIMSRLPRVLDPLSYMYDEIESDQYSSYLQMAKRALSKREYCNILIELHAHHPGAISDRLILNSAIEDSCCDVLEYMNDDDILNGFQEALRHFRQSPSEAVIFDAVDSADSLTMAESVASNVDLNVEALSDSHRELLQDLYILKAQCEKKSHQ